MKYIDPVLLWLSRSDRLGHILMRLAIAMVFIWIGAVKFAPYEADSIAPFVAKNPVLSLFYKYPDQYKAHLTHEGELVPTQREWQRANHTYAFSNGLGTVEIVIGLLVLAGLVFTRLGAAGAAGAALAFLTALVTLSFLITTPEAWVPALGDAQHGFPYLSSGGRLVVKDVMLLAGAFLLMVQSAKELKITYRFPGNVNRKSTSNPQLPGSIL
jgi:reactive chlorine resistance protein C